MDLLTLLAQKGVIDQSEATTIAEEVEQSQSSLEDVLVKHGVSSEDILNIKSEALQVPSRSVDDASVPSEVLSYIPEESALHYKIVPLGIRDGVLEVGAVDPDNIEAVDALNFISSKANLPYKIYLITEADFEKIMEQYRGLGAEVGKAVSELDSELSSEEQRSQSIEELGEEIQRTAAGDEADIKEDAPVTKIVASVLRFAVEGRASDVHIEPKEDQIRVRFRVDGVLHTSITLPRKVHRAVVARIKILSSMRLDERRKPQDGRFSATIEGRKIDFRVSTFPTYFGEKVVMRILDREAGVRSLTELGLSAEHLEQVQRAVRRPYGLIVISGPTGSGKTSTLYSMLNDEVNRAEKNVISLEDPVEYNVDGVSQSQVRPEIGYTFASGLRSVLRQDPDVIMVGEIRDKETAQLAIQAALTGHLVLSTIHTNTAIGVIPRLVDMGIDPYLIAPTLVLAIAQRLTRTLCEGTGTPIPVEGSMRMLIEKEFEDLPEEHRSKITLGDTVYGIEKTDDCPNGTRGRIGVFEVMEMNHELERAILEDPSDETIRRIARKNGMLTMKEDAILKAFDKVIPFEEVNTLGGELLAVEGEPEAPVI